MKAYNDLGSAFFLTVLLFLLIFLSPQAKAGAVEGIRLCEDIILPSLLPVLILSQVLLRSRSRRGLERLLSPLFRRVFHLHGAAAAAVVLGLVAGYPSGALLTQALYRSKAITASEAKRLMRFNMSGGAAFIISAVGMVHYGSRQIGALLFLCVTLAALTTALLFRPRYAPKPVASPPALPLTEALPAATEASVKALALMSAYIVLFCAFSHLAPLPAPLLPVLEITVGIFRQRLPLPQAAFFLSFGGLCVHLQLFSCLQSMRVRYLPFLTGRLLCAVLSYLFCRCFLLLPIFRACAAVVAMAPGYRPAENTVLLSALLVIGCAAAVFDIENRKIRLN